MMLKKLLFILPFCSIGCSGEQTNTKLLFNQSQYDAIQIKNFWSWFGRERVLFETMTDSTHDEILNIMLEHLSPVSENLAVEVSKEFHGVRDIVISADGDKNKFPIVEAIVRGAPKISGWTVTALRQRASEDFTLKYGSLQFSSAEMGFRTFIENDSLDLVIYADSIKNKNREDVIKYGLITMDNIIGEYDATMKVRSFDFKDSREIDRKKQVYKLKKLPAFVDSTYAKSHLISKQK
ncbi:hypothetical protein GCM10027422_42770 [Hymenobacter arcticus]